MLFLMQTGFRITMNNGLLSSSTSHINLLRLSLFRGVLIVLLILLIVQLYTLGHT